MRKNWLKENLKGFTLIELLVVILIVAVLAAIALPQYQRAVEKARMVEAVAHVRTIANAHQFYYLTHGEYLKQSDMNKLDVIIPGTVAVGWGGYRIKTTDFVYSPNSDGGGFLAVAHRIAKEGYSKDVYYIHILQNSPQRIHCSVYLDGSASAIQRKLCNELNTKGSL